MREVQRFMCGGALLLLAACDGGGGTRPDPSVATTLTPTSPATQSGTAGSAAPAAPAVRVLDQRSQPMAGVGVTFTVTSGGGSVSVASTTTDAGGNASAGVWTMGTTAGSNTVTAAAGSLQATFTATAGPAALAALQKTGGDSQSAAVGTALADSLAVRAVDAFGNPVPGQSVAFAVTSGGGTLSAGAATTSAAGVAKVRLTLGTTPGAHSVAATAGSAPPAVFTATATAGPPAALVKVAGDNQTAPAGSLVPVRPAVRVTDAFGNPVAGVAVTFTVTGGGGTVTGAAASTGAGGQAAVGGWTLGLAPGANTLSAGAASLPPVTFTATGQQTQDPCDVAVPHAFGTSTQGRLDPEDCQLDDGSRVDFYTLDLAAASNFRVSLSSAAFDAFLFVADAAGQVVAVDDDSGTGVNALAHILAPAGRYIIVANSLDANVFGAYTVSTSAGGSVTSCEPAFLVPGVSVTQALESADCLSGGFYYDEYVVALRAGQTLTIQQSSAAFDTFLELYSASGTRVAFNDDGGGGTNSRIVFTAPAAGAYIIVPSSFSSGTLGGYTLTVQ